MNKYLKSITIESIVFAMKILIVFLVAWFTSTFIIIFVSQLWLSARIEVEDKKDVTVCESFERPWNFGDRLFLLVFPIIAFTRGVDTSELCGSPNKTRLEDIQLQLDSIQQHIPTYGRG